MRKIANCSALPAPSLRLNHVKY